MIMMGDKKKMLTAILGPEHELSNGPGAMDSLEAVAKELIECILNHDAKGVADALKAAVELCDGDENKEVESEIEA